jgi:peroxiredoxin
MLAAGESAPDFELADLDGSNAKLKDLLRFGRVVAAFLKVSCPTCQLTFPFLDKIQASTPGVLRIVGISQDNEADTKTFRTKFSPHLAMLLDEKETGYRASKAYQITHVPSIFLIERDGSISASWNGFSRKGLESLGERAGVAGLLDGESVPDFKPG